MKKLICDVCKHTVDDPVVNRNYFHICHRDICEPCKDALELSLKQTVRTKEPFNYEWYSKLMHDDIEKAIQKGKF
jgi:formylmethanofuran dehydrogenase subunit B